MREVVLPTSGEFARIERIKFSDLIAGFSAPNLIVALIERVVTIEGRPIDLAYLDSMALADAFLIWKLISDELAPVGIAKGVA